MSAVFGRQYFNTGVLCTIVSCTKRELKATIFKTGHELRLGVSGSHFVGDKSTVLNVFIFRILKAVAVQFHGHGP